MSGGDRKAQRPDDQVHALHAELGQMLQRIAWAILRDWDLAADAVQETFALFTQRLEEIEEPQRRGWLVRTVQFHAMNLRRKESNASRTVQSLHESPEGYLVSRADSAGESPSGTAEKNERLEELRAAIKELPREQQAVVQMRLVDELTFAQIAEQLEVPLGTILSRMRLALEKLKKRLSNDHE